jgi:channel protein (hemolysin III family)
MMVAVTESIPLAPTDLYSLPGFHDPVSALTHLLAAPVFLALSFDLLRRGRGSVGRQVYLGVFAASTVFLLSMSGVYHMMVNGGTARAVMERLDHSGIFLLIAGTFTPAHGILFRGRQRWAPLLLIWTCAVAGITLRSIFLSDFSAALGLTIYLGLGWLGLVSTIVLWQRYGFAFVRFLLLGGVMYTVGALTAFIGGFVVIPGVVGPHELLHLCVLVALACHWRFVYHIADGSLSLRTALNSLTERGCTSASAGPPTFNAVYGASGPLALVHSANASSCNMQETPGTVPS